MLDENENFLSSPVEESFLSPPLTVPIEPLAHRPYVPVNAEEQAVSITFANDTTAAGGDIAGKMALNLDLIRKGKIEDLKKPIVSQEQNSYVDAAADMVVTQASLGRLEQATQAAFKHNALVRSKIAADKLSAVDTNAVIAGRALEVAAVQDPDKDRVPRGKLITNLEEYREAHGLRNTLLSALAKMGEPSDWDKITHVLTGAAPLTPLAQEETFRRIVQRATGKEVPLGTNPMVYVEKLYEVWSTLDANAKNALVKSIVEDEYGVFSQNEAAKQDFIRRVSDLTFAEGQALGFLNVVFGFMDVAVVLAAAFGKATAKGTLAKSLKETAGERFAGKEIADAITHRRAGPLGLNDAQTTGAAISAGEHPYTVNPGSLEGVSPHVQERLKQTWDEFIALEKERLATTGLPHEEVANQLRAIEASYSPAIDKGIYSIKFMGDVNNPRAKFTILIQAEDGKFLRSLEAARDVARRRGLADDVYEVVTKRQVDAEDAAGARANIQAFHGGGDFSEFRAKFIGLGHGGDSLGHGFYASLVKSMAERSARGRRVQGKEPTLYELSLPDQKFFLDFDKKFTKQSDEVKQALARVLTPDEIGTLKGKTGREVYNVLKNRMGSVEHASKVLEKEGIAGNTGTTMGRDREFLVFSEDLMNRSVVRKTSVEGGETAAMSKASRAADDAENEQALQFLEEFGMREGDALRMSIAVHKSFLAITPDGVRRMSTNRIFDNPTVGLFGKDATPIQFSGSFNTDAENYYTGFLKLLGMEDERVLFVTGEDVGRLVGRPEFQSQHVQRQLQRDSKILTTQRGLYDQITLDDGSVVHLIGIKDEPHAIQGVFVGAHEIGHMFDFVYLRTLHADKRAALKKDFETWVAKRYGKRSDLKEMAERVLSPDEGRLSTYRAFQQVEEGAILSAENIGKLAQMREWLSFFDEFIAEQMSKWARSDARAVNVGESVWAGWRDQLVAYYQKVAARMQVAFGGEVMSSSPELAFKQLMDDHLERVAKMREVGVLGKMKADELNFTALVAIADIRGPMQPARKRSMPSFRGPMGAAAPSPSPTDEFLLRVRMDDPINAQGMYDPADISSMSKYAIDPRHSVSVDAMAGRVVGVHQTARMRKDMVQMLEKPLRALSKGKRERVLAVLEEGDQASHAGGYGKEFSASELLAKGLTESELEAYFTVRQARMLNYFVHNKAMVESMRRKGLMEVEVYGQGKFAGKPLTIEEAKAKNKATVYDMESKGFIELDADVAYAEGKRLINVPSGATVDGQEVTYFLAKDAHATARTIHTALHYRPGEFARIYSDNYFIRMGSQRVVDGVKQTIERPIRTASTEKEAMEFINAVVDGKDAVNSGASRETLERLVGKFYSPEEFQNQVLSGELKDFTSLRFHFTREIDDYLGQTVEAHAHAGKLFTRDRGEHLGVADRTRAARSNILNPYESLSREMTMVSHFANVTEWKESQIGRWMNTFGDMLGSARTGDDVRDFFKAAGGTFSHITGKRGLFAERTHRYIMRQAGIQTQEHRWWQSLMRRTGEGSMSYVGEGVGAMIRDASPLNFIRSINHHLTLGLFNASQLIVQANGAAIAVAIHPIYGMKAASLYPALRIALMSDNPEVWARIAKVAGEDVGKLAQAIRKSGLIDNLRSTSLHNIEDGKMDIFASMPRRALGTVIEKGAFFFNRGEEAARIISFDIARREWQHLHPGKDFLTQEGMQWIVSKADDYTMNMTRANLARWQEGIMSIPTQFLQYNLKFMQNIASGLMTGGGKGRGFTRSEAVKALAGSIAFYGAAGLGVSRLMGEWIPDEVEEKMSPLTKTAIGQGVFAAALKAMGESLTGERLDVALGTRLGSINFFTDMVYNAFTDPKNIYEAMLGPTRTTGERLGVIADVVNLWRKQPEVTLNDVGREGLAVFTEQISSARNLTKAYYIHQGNRVLKNRKGEATAELSTPEIWAQALGLAPTEAYDYYNMLSTKQAYFRSLDGVADMIFDTQKKIMEARNTGDLDRVARLEKGLQLMWPDNYGDFMHVRNKITTKLFPYDTKFQQLLVDHALKPGHYEKPFTTTSPK